MPYSIPGRHHSRAFAPLDIPRRQPHVFHYHDNDDHDSSSSSDDDHHDDHHHDDKPFNLCIPFPALPSPPSPLPRTTSSPIFLSNGKPLKSSLKSSSSSPNIPSPQLPNTSHTRARSAPSSPCPKNVHFPSKEQGGLETIRLFSRSAKPASLSATLSQDDTETETDSEPPGFPFPLIPKHTQRKRTYAIDTHASSPVPAPAPAPHANVHLEALALTHRDNDRLALTGTLLVRNLAYEKTVAVRFTLDDWHTTSEVAARHLTSLPALPPALFRPGSGLRSPHPADPCDTNTDPNPDPDDAGPTWDRFTFLIHLEDYAHTLDRRTMWLVARYLTPSCPFSSTSLDPAALGPAGAPDLGHPTGGGGEWWDNNCGRNYRVGFRAEERGEEEGERVFVRRTAVSAPSLTTPAPAAASPSPLLSPLPLRTPSPPSQPQPLPHHPTPGSAHDRMVAQTTMSRLRKLSFSNYSAPVPAATITTPSVAVRTPPGLEDNAHIHDWDFPATRSAAPKAAFGPTESGTAFEASTSPPGVSAAMGVYWSWGTTPGAAVKTGDDETPIPDTPRVAPPTLTLRLPTPSPARHAHAHAHVPRHSSPLASPTRTSPFAASLVPPGLAHGHAGLRGGRPPKSSPLHSPVHSPRVSPAHSPPKHSPVHSPPKHSPVHSPPKHSSVHLPPKHSPVHSPPKHSPVHLPPKHSPVHSSPKHSPAHPPSSPSPQSSAESIDDFFTHAGYPRPPPHPKPPSSASPPPAGTLDTDSLYQAFVRKWCFAGSDAPLPANGFSGSVVTPRMGGTPPVGAHVPGARKGEKHEREEGVVGF